MNKSAVQAKWQKLASKVKRPWGENINSQPKKPVVDTGDTAKRKTEPGDTGPQPKDRGHD